VHPLPREPYNDEHRQREDAVQKISTADQMKHTEAALFLTFVQWKWLGARELMRMPWGGHGFTSDSETAGTRL